MADDLKTKVNNIAKNAFIPPVNPKQVWQKISQSHPNPTGAISRVLPQFLRGGGVTTGVVEGELETSLIPGVGELALIGLAATAAVAGIIAAVEFHKKDNAAREAFTQQFVAHASQKFPNCNVVICHPKHSVTGLHVVHQHHELKMTVGTCGYDSYCSPKGQPFTFDNQGDGGFLNWAYAGQFSRNGNTLTAA